MIWGQPRKQFAAKRHRESRGWRFAIVVGVLILATYVLLSFVYHRVAGESQSSPATYFAEKISDWFAEHRHSHEKKPKPAKRAVASKQSSEPRIHFEFYRTLPSAEMPGLKPDQRPTIAMIGDAAQLERELLEAAQGKQKARKK